MRKDESQRNGHVDLENHQTWHVEDKNVLRLKGFWEVVFSEASVAVVDGDVIQAGDSAAHDISVEREQKAMFNMDASDNTTQQLFTVTLTATAEAKNTCAKEYLWRNVRW